MAAELLHNRNRALSLGAALALHAVAIALLVLFGSSAMPKLARVPALIAMPLRPPPPPPPPDAIDEGAAAPPSRGQTEAPSPPEPPRPLPKPTPAEVAIDPGSAQASGAGAAAGSGAGQGGVGNGTGSGGAGNGTGAGRVTPPVRIAGQLTNADYRAARPPEGAAGTVVVSFTVRTNGRADSCSVIRSSGYAEFDQATCRLIEQRFRYRPATDQSGRPIDWTIRTDYTWSLEPQR
jgi:protein TonB